MKNDHRLKRLRDLLAELERLPASAERDRMLHEVRGRLVDVDTGVAPRALRPADPDSTPAGRPRSSTTPKVEAPKPAEDGRRRPTALPQPATPVGVPPREPVRRAGAELVPDGLLCLDDSTPFEPDETRSATAAAPWTRGLRG